MIKGIETNVMPTVVNMIVDIRRRGAREER